MSTRRVAAAVAAAAVAAAPALSVTSANAGSSTLLDPWPEDMSGLPILVLQGEFGPPVGLKNGALLDRTELGYRYWSGQQDNKIRVTLKNGWLRLRDRGTRELRSLPDGCRERDKRRGILARCPMPLTATELTPMFLEIWPRLGDDRVDGSTLPASVRMWVLADAGNDVIHTGAGHDFVNGAQDDDIVWGGDGHDWIRTGIGNDDLYGEAGDDKLVGADGDDRIYGGPGDDRLYGAGGQDLLHDESGVDRLYCGAGSLDRFLAGPEDRVDTCEIDLSLVPTDS